MTDETIARWIQDYLSRLLGIPRDEIDPGVPLKHFGLDSTAAVGLCADLADFLGVPIDDDLLYRYPTIRAIAGHLAG